ncbi:MAG: hypothetical protein FWC39_10595 [Bacteroidetes bacterium]|nr:hypothetical protein [Bacteroidota bacterium]
MNKSIEIQKVFNFNPSNQQIRVKMINEDAFFVAKDVCSILGIKYHRDAVARLDDDEKRASVSLDTPYGNQHFTMVNESGLYALIFQSSKPEAKTFRKWVTSEVLPAIRKHGKYEPWQNGAIMYYNPANNRELVENFCDIATHEIVKITNTRQRVRLYNLVKFMRSKIQ